VRFTDQFVYASRFRAYATFLLSIFSCAEVFNLRTALIRGRLSTNRSMNSQHQRTSDKLSGVCELRERVFSPSRTRGGREHELSQGFCSFTARTCKRAALHARERGRSLSLGQCSVSWKEIAIPITPRICNNFYRSDNYIIHPCAACRYARADRQRYGTRIRMRVFVHRTLLMSYHA